MTKNKLNIGVLVSGSGTNLQAIIDASKSGNLDVDVRLVISNKPDVVALDRAYEAGIRSFVILRKRYETREKYEEDMVKELRKYGVELVVLAGFMRILGPTFLESFKGKVVNIHPSLLPSFKGLHAQRQALEYGVKYTGCTVHFVDEGMDTGTIIDQVVVPVLENDTEETLSNRILVQEHMLYPRVLQHLAVMKQAIINGDLNFIKSLNSFEASVYFIKYWSDEDIFELCV